MVHKHVRTLNVHSAKRGPSGSRDRPLTSHASFVVHARPCRGKRWSLQAGRSSGVLAAAVLLPPDSHSASKSTPSQTRTTGTPTRSLSESVKLLFDPKSSCWRSPADPAGVLQSLLSRPPNRTPPALSYSFFPSPPLAEQSAFSLKVQLISPFLTFPPLAVPPGRSKQFYAFTGNHPEHLGPGSFRRKLQSLCGRWKRGSSLLCEDFSTHQALHCIDFFFPPKGSERVRQHSVILCRWPK